MSGLYVDKGCEWKLNHEATAILWHFNSAYDRELKSTSQPLCSYGSTLMQQEQQDAQQCARGGTAAENCLSTGRGGEETISNF